MPAPQSSLSRHARTALVIALALCLDLALPIAAPAGAKVKQRLGIVVKSKRACRVAQSFYDSQPAAKSARRKRRARCRQRPRKAASPLFRGSFWNTRLQRSTRLDPTSKVLVRELLTMVDDEVERRNGPWINTTRFSVPVYEVPRDQRRVRVTLDVNNPALQSGFESVPIPRRARAAQGTDQHMAVWQRSTNRMWEFWKMHRERDGWHARWGGAMNHVSTSPGYFTTHSWEGSRPNWGATATSLPLLGGLMRIDELRAGRFDHALAIALPRIRRGSWSWPAQRTDGNIIGGIAIPEGARFRLDPRLNLARLKLPRLTRMMAEAAQRYGIVVRDYAGVVTFLGEDPAGEPNPWPRAFGGGYPSEVLARFPWNRLQLLKLEMTDWKTAY
jgi:hypothetical protein